MVVHLLLFITGIALLWLCSELVVRNIPVIARRLGVNELTVTILGVSVFSSLPELSVSAISALNGNAEIALGNVIGSNFVTLTLVTAICALIAPINMRQEIRDRESSWMILSTVIIMLLAMDMRLSRIDGLILIGLYVPYVISVLRDMRSGGHDEPHAVIKTPLWRALVIEGAAIAGVVFGAKFSLDHGQALAKHLGMPDLLLGAILFAFGTSLPEMAIAVSATLKKKAEISMGEIYSSNSFTAMGILGICCLIRPLQIADARVINIDITFLILAGIIVQIFITTRAKLNRIEAVIILLLYGYFVATHIWANIIPWTF